MIASTYRLGTVASISDSLMRNKYEITMGEFIDSHTTGNVTVTTVYARNLAEAAIQAENLRESNGDLEIVRIQRVK